MSYPDRNKPFKLQNGGGMPKSEHVPDLHPSALHAVTSQTGTGPSVYSQTLRATLCRVRMHVHRCPRAPATKPRSQAEGHKTSCGLRLIPGCGELLRGTG